MGLLGAETGTKRGTVRPKWEESRECLEPSGQTSDVEVLPETDDV